MISLRSLLILLFFSGVSSACQQSLPLGQHPIQLYPTDYLIRDAELYDFFTVDESGITLYSSPEDRQLGNIEAKIYPEEYAFLRAAFRSQKPDSLLSLYQQKGTQRWSERAVGTARKYPWFSC